MLTDLTSIGNLFEVGGFLFFYNNSSLTALSAEGLVLVDFRDSNNLKLKEYTEKIINRQCIITINGLSSGKYSFKYFHDANNNKKLDTYWIGAPKEGYGFSNNAKGNFGPPNFAETLFQLTKNTTFECIPTYIEF
ncbi:MAG: DUF2141 domain-containing protein [Vicingaceae bacterium]|nr:DUF2141 domain-containing protein [Vicingaceae bacterium]